MKFLVMDIGKLHVSTAKRLAEDGNEVFYYSPWYEAYPKFREFAPGVGVPGLRNVIDFGSVIDKADVVVFPDVGMGKFAHYLRKHGKKVFGAGLGEVLEMNRKGCNEIYDKVGIARPKSWYVKGVDKAIELIDQLQSQKMETNQNADGKYFVKLDVWRGSGETFPVQSTEDAKIMFDTLKQSIGPFESQIDITIQQKIEGIECGADYFFDGEKFVMPGMWGFESGASYVGKISSDLKIYEKDLNKIAVFLKKTGYRGAFSFEAIFDGKRLYWIDATTRFPMPLGMIYVNYAKDFGQLISDVANGNAKDSQLPEGKYLACMEVISDEGNDKWLPLIGGNNTRFLRYMVKDEKMYHVPGIQMLGAICGEGDSMYAAQESAVKESENLSVFYATFNKNFVDDIIEKYVDPMDEQGIVFEKGEKSTVKEESKQYQKDDVIECMNHVEEMLNELW